MTWADLKAVGPTWVGLFKSSFGPGLARADLKPLNTIFRLVLSFFCCFPFHGYFAHVLMLIRVKNKISRMSHVYSK